MIKVGMSIFCWHCVDGCIGLGQPEFQQSPVCIHEDSGQ